MKAAVLGGGISGLICGWLMKKSGIDFRVFEQSPFYGGLARSFTWHGFSCDIASHRIFTRNPEVLAKLKSAVPMIRNRRQSRIFIGGKWVRDPVDPFELVAKFFPNPGINFAVDYMLQGFSKDGSEESFDSYVLSKYGRSLNEFFFKPYTEKLFGIPADEVSVEWARQKVRASSLTDMIRRNTKIYFSYFHYPEEGGMGAFAETFYTEIKDTVLLSTQVKKLHTNGNEIISIAYEKNTRLIEEKFDIIVSTLPITELGKILGFQPDLIFRPVTLVYLLVNKPRVSNNHWVYFGHEDVIINRLGEFKNFSENGVPENTTVLCAEITMNPGNENPAAKAVTDLHRIGIINKRDILDTLSIKEDFAYPVYTKNFAEEVEMAMGHFGKYENLFLLGRNAKFRHKEIDDNFDAALKLVEKIKIIRNSKRYMELTN